MRRDLESMMRVGAEVMPGLGEGPRASARSRWAAVEQWWPLVRVWKQQS